MQSRQILVFLDGTSNTLTGHRTDTNVLHLFEHVSRRQLEHQIVYYDPGVGSPDLLPYTDLKDWFSRKWEHLSGLASGRGIFENVGQAYMFIANHYRPGDQIFVFGFSRGAFTARSVAGMIHLFGLIRPEHESLLLTLLRVYFADSETSADPKTRQTHKPPPRTEQTDSILKKQKHRSEVAEQVRASFTTPAGREAQVHFVGVWDTVATVGLWPFSLRIRSKATIKEKRIRHVRQALALDEHRAVFEPRLYSDDNFGTHQDPQSMKQLWFRGVHCDVGGGYVEKTSGLSNEALLWMADEARACGMDCDPKQLVATVEELAKPNRVERWVHDPLRELGLWAVVGMHVRDTTHALGTDGKGTAVTPVPYTGDAGAPAPKSVWSGWKDLLWAVPFLVAAVITTIASSAWAQSESGSISQALSAGRNFAMLQASALWNPGGSLDRLNAIGRAKCARVLGLDTLFIVFYTIVLSIVLSRAFARAAGWRKAGDGPSWLSWLGAALPVLVLGDLLENALGLLAIWRGSGWSAKMLLWLASIESWAKLAGLLGCALLLLVGVLLPRRAQTA